MSGGQSVLADEMGRFAGPVSSSRELTETDWEKARILVSETKLMLVRETGKQTVQFSELRGMDVTEDAPRVLPISDYITLRIPAGLLVIAPADREAVEHAIFRAFLDGQQVLVNHPAVEGGVVQDTSWTKGRLDVQQDELAFATADGDFVTVTVDDVGSVEVETQTVRGKNRPVVTSEFVGDESVFETEFTCSSQHVRVLATFFRKGEQRKDTDIELGETSRAVLVALYSDIDPTDVPGFVDEDVETVEEIYDDLIDAGLLDCRRVRREVQLQTRGRMIASESMESR